MMIFCLRLKMHTDHAAAFHLWLARAGRQIGITPTSMTNDSDDLDTANPDYQVYGFVCQAQAALKPKQLVALFTECERICAAVLEIVYQETENTDDDSEGEDGEQTWRELARTVHRFPDRSATRRSSTSPRLELLPGGISDDPDE